MRLSWITALCLFFAPTGTAAIDAALVEKHRVLQVLQFDSSDGCHFHNYTVHANEVTLSFSMMMRDTEGWRTIRNDVGWDNGDVHVMLWNGKLYFALAGNYPSEHWFSNTFQANVSYHISLEYSIASKSVSLTVDGKWLETKDYWASRCVCITPGYVGCWKKEGSFRDKFEGTISDLAISARGVHQMRYSPEDRPPAILFGADDVSWVVFYVVLLLALVMVVCLSGVLLYWRRQRRKSRLINLEEAPESPVVGRPLGGYVGAAVTGHCAPGGKKEDKPFVCGYPVAGETADGAVDVVPVRPSCKAWVAPDGEALKINVPEGNSRQARGDDLEVQEVDSDQD